MDDTERLNRIVDRMSTIDEEIIKKLKDLIKWVEALEVDVKALREARHE